jgi:anti-sigma B factor antagonist
MNLEIKKEGEVSIVKPLNKDINASVSTDFKGSFVDLINQGNNYFLLNLSLVDFIDSSGLGAIISILKTLEHNKGVIALCEIQEPVLNLFRLTRMNQVFKIFESEEDGLKFINNANKS